MNETLIGFTLNIIACFAFGFMFLPLRKVDCKDSFFVQWVYSIAVLLVGFAVNFIRGFPPFIPLAMLGGALSAIGSMAAVPLMKNIGLSVGMMLWGDAQVITGWAIARFGLLGTKPQPVYNNMMNVAGVLIIIISGIMFGFVKHEIQKEELLLKDPVTKMKQNNCNEKFETVEFKQEAVAFVSNKNVSELSESSPQCSCLKLLYVGMAIVIGVFHGFNMTPITYIIENYNGASTDVLDYVFAHYCAVTISTTIIFIIYCICKKNRPFVSSELVLPSFTYGFLWSGGMVLFFIANRLLSQTVSYPITMRLPSTITLIGDLLLFRTVKVSK
uniref:Transmembrane protein 144 n=1 Tax=Syphacia muris TaxID=451379 RepID=A0A0N5ANS3_9BILA